MAKERADKGSGREWRKGDEEGKGEVVLSHPCPRAPRSLSTALMSSDMRSVPDRKLSLSICERNGNRTLNVIITC